MWCALHHTAEGDAMQTIKKYMRLRIRSDAIREVVAMHAAVTHTGAWLPMQTAWGDVPVSPQHGAICLSHHKHCRRTSG